jgi:hypothetical protein
MACYLIGSALIAAGIAVANVLPAVPAGAG